MTGNWLWLSFCVTERNRKPALVTFLSSVIGNRPWLRFLGMRRPLVDPITSSFIQMFENIKGHFEGVNYDLVFNQCFMLRLYYFYVEKRIWKMIIFCRQGVINNSWIAPRRTSIKQRKYKFWEAEKVFETVEGTIWAKVIWQKVAQSMNYLAHYRG